MKRINNILVALAALLGLSSCAERMEEPCGVPFVDKEIVIDFSSPDVRAKATVEDTGYESYISHLDILVFEQDGSLYWHERVSVSAAEGSHTLDVNTGYFTKKDAYGNVLSPHPLYNVHVLANCNFDMEFSEADKSLSVSSGGVLKGIYDMEGDIGAIVMEEPHLHLSGLNIPVAPPTFLMHSVSKAIYLSDPDPEKNIVIKADLERAAAKVVLNIMEGEHVEFTEGADLKTPGLFDKSERGLYYIRNMPFCTTLFPRSNVVADKSQLLTTPKTNSAHFTWNPASFRTDTTKMKTSDEQADIVSIVTYVYEHDWNDIGVFENEPVAIVNLPLIFIEEHDGEIGYHAHADSWYKIPLSKSKKFERNNYYKVNVKINYAGATTVMEPVIVPDIKYEVQDYEDGNIGWKTQTVTINQSVRPKYLTLNQEQVDMVSSSVNETVQFSSSSDVTVSIASCYYINKFGREIALTGNDLNGIRVSAAPGVSGTIKVEAPVPLNNTPRYIRVRVSNGESEDKYFMVVQYPLEYITNVQGYYSYRSDFGGTTYETYKSSRIVSANWKNQTWSYSTSTGQFFTSKVAKLQSNASGESNIYYYSWRNRNSKEEKLISGLNNGRMYRVKLASSSADYSVGIPRLDEDGWTDSSQENSLLVSPSFMIASQLGATMEPSSVTQAASHCSYYVETYKDESGNVVHLDDWRLPTEAEIKIIIRFQYPEEGDDEDVVAMDEVLAGQWYWSATGTVRNEKSKDTDTKSAVRCVRNDF